MSFPRILMVSLAALAIGDFARGAEPITTRALLTQNTDLAALAQFPSPPFTCRQFSSYDRASTTPDDPEGWFANGDYNQYLRVEERDGRKEHVMMDADGPGAIVRNWSANPKGTLRLYLDGGEQPAWTIPLPDLLSGKVEGVPEPLAHVRSAGWNCYLLTADLRLPKLMRLTPSKKTPLYNGAIECRLFLDTHPDCREAAMAYAETAPR